MNKLIALLLILTNQWLYASIDIQLPDTQITQEKQAAYDHPSGLIKVATATPIKDVHLIKGSTSQGQWTKIDKDTWRWEIRFSSKNATYLNIGMSGVFLPHSATLSVRGKNKLQPSQKFSDQNNQDHGFLWSGEIDGPSAHITLTVDANEKEFVRLSIDRVARGFHSLDSLQIMNKSASCQIDVVCDAGDNWDAQISSVARYTFQNREGGFLCTGQLINNTAQDGTPYFLTADHCGFSSLNGQVSLTERQNVASSIQLIWNYESQTCRATGSVVNGQAIPNNSFSNRQNGAKYIASNPFTDMALIELNRIPSSDFQIEYTGWDRSEEVPQSATTIHHPNGHAKRISRENDAIHISSHSATIGQGDGSHFRINDWDLGTTEIGSSGAGLWNDERLLVGQLHGGEAACGNDEPDWYGRFATAWDHGNQINSRLKEWLDPLNTGQLTLRGSAGCDAPSVDISVLGEQKTGNELTLIANTTGGSGGYQFEWDTNADGVIDAKSSQVLITYNQSFINSIKVKVIDSSGCSIQARHALTIQAPDVRTVDIQSVQNELTQMCGNNDNVIDPGERWKTRFQFENLGSQTATATFATLTKDRGETELTTQNSDNFGNNSSACASNFIDISQTGRAIDWIKSSDEYPSHDEGVTVQIDIPNTSLYGVEFNTLRASSNGYLSPDEIIGTDFSNDCPLPFTPDQDNGSARIAPMHSDLQNSTFYHQTFDVCPRQAESGTHLSCEVFMWQGADFWDTNETENIDFQAILYPSTGQWAYQYQGPGVDGATSTTGIQNRNATDGLTFACNQVGSINQNQAVCIFEKEHPNLSIDSNAIFLETPLLDLGTLSAGANSNKEVIFSVRKDAQCGKNFALNHQATVFEEGFNLGTGQIFEGTVGTPSECSVISHCDIDDSNQIQPLNGIWWNPNRSGNGYGMSFINKQRLMYVAYTGNPDRQPIWYITGLESSEKDQYYNELYQISYNGSFETGSQIAEQIGWSDTSVIDQSHAVQVRRVNGQFSAEKLTLQILDLQPTTSMHTGFYYAPDESGWGESVATMGNAIGIVNYIYDETGAPYWTSAWGTNNASQLLVGYTESFCQHCPWIEPNSVAAGTLTMTFDEQRTGHIIEYNVNVPESLKPNAKWSRSQLPVLNLVPPNNDSP